MRFVEQGKRSVQLDSLLALLDTLGLELRLETRTSSAARALAGGPAAGGMARRRRPPDRPEAPAMKHRVADVYKAGVLAARLERHGGGTRFSYLPAYLAAGRPRRREFPAADRGTGVLRGGGGAAVFHRAAAGGAAAECAAPLGEDQRG